MEFKTIVSGNRTIEVATDSLSAVRDMISEYDALKAEYDAFKAASEKEMCDMKEMFDKKMADMSCAKDSLTSEIEGLKTAVELTKDSVSETVTQQVAERLQAWQEIGGVENDSVSFDAALTPIQIKQKFLENTVGSEVFDGKDAGFVQGMFYALQNKPSKVADVKKEASFDAKPKQQSSSYARHSDGTTGFSIFNR